MANRNIASIRISPEVDYYVKQICKIHLRSFGNLVEYLVLKERDFLTQQGYDIKQYRENENGEIDRN